LTVFAPRISLGYRAGPSSWNVRCADGHGSNWVKAFALADDHEDNNGETVLDFWQATDKARQIARGEDGSDIGRPATVDEAIDSYRDDLIARGGNPGNATGLRNHIPPALLAKPVGITTAKDWRAVRDAMRKTVKGSTVNRYAKNLKACLTLAAKLDARIVNAKAWKDGLSSVAENDSEDCNVVLTDAQRLAVVAEAYHVGQAFGLYVEVHACTGARSSQLALLNVADLQMNGGAARLMVPSSLKGGRTQRTRTPVPIPPGLTMRLRTAAAGRADGEPLLRNSDGERWQPKKGDHQTPFAQARKAAKLRDDATLYCLRHSSITHQLLKGVPTRVVAALHDTSVQQVEKTYSRHIGHHSDPLIRRAMFEADAPVAGNVVAMR
jgi:integrase